MVLFLQRYCNIRFHFNFQACRSWTPKAFFLWPQSSGPPLLTTGWTLGCWFLPSCSCSDPSNRTSLPSEPLPSSNSLREWSSLAHPDTQTPLRVQLLLCLRWSGHLLRCKLFQASPAERRQIQDRLNALWGTFTNSLHQNKTLFGCWKSTVNIY